MVSYCYEIGVYNTLRDVFQPWSGNDDTSIEVSYYQTTLSEEGFSRSNDLIPKDNIYIVFN